jgi:hypothetical protein
MPTILLAYWILACYIHNRIVANRIVVNVRGLSMSSGLTRTVGNWVDGDRFWDREIEMALFIEKLDDGDHLLLVAQRRIGKTSLMRQAARLIEERYVCLHVDLQEAASAADAIAELGVETRKYKSLWGKTKDIWLFRIHYADLLGLTIFQGFQPCYRAPTCFL